MRTLLDTGPLIALVDRDDSHHQQCVRLLETLEGTLLLPTTVLIETCWMVNRYLGPRVQANFLARAGEDYTLVDLEPPDLLRMSELVRTYSDMHLDPTDASVIILAERLEISQVATLDRRDFRAVRPRHLEALTLLP